MGGFRKLISFFLHVLVVFLIAAAGYFIVLNKIGIMSRETLIIGVTAFFGAFFAFGFARLSERLAAAKKRNSVHFSALVKIERLLNRTIAQLDKDTLLAKDDMDALSSGKILVWNLPPIPFSHDLSDDLMNIDFINDYFTLTIDIETINRDLTLIMSMYNESKSLFLSKVISPEDHKDNVGFTIKQLSEITKFMESHQVHAIELLAKARILVKEQKQKAFLLGARPRKNYGKDMGQLLHKELLALENEIGHTKKNSQEEIDKIRRKRTY
jgi:hypothetical protein